MAAVTQESIPPLSSTMACLCILPIKIFVLVFAPKRPWWRDPRQTCEAADRAAPAIHPQESIPPKLVAATLATSPPGRQIPGKKARRALSGDADVARGSLAQTCNQAALKGQTSLH